LFINPYRIYVSNFTPTGAAVLPAQVKKEQEHNIYICPHCASLHYIYFMKVQLIAIGDNEEGWLSAGFRTYEQRLTHYLSFETILIPSPKNKTKTREAILEGEANLILKKIPPADYLILLDSGGREFGSEDLALHISKLFNMPGKKIVFLLGGAYGFAPAIYERAQMKLSLSRLTFNHQLARLVFLEQLYRAMTILKGEKYHH
jgi:23S rRNA (pseudouridine1915-N3)-methyltransferase